MEGSIFSAGSAVQWLRDGLKIIGTAAETESLAASLNDNRGVYLVPAFTGLGAPYWDSHARGALYGLTRDTGVAEIARATLESVCYQTHDLLDAMKDDGNSPQMLRVDGGMVRNDWMVQFLADILGIPIERPVETETTALGAAYLAGLQAGLYGALDDLSELWQCATRFEPRIDNERRGQLIAAWRKAVSRTLT